MQQTTSTFVFPPFHNLPPFYTLQPVLATRKKQLELWGELVLRFCEHHNIHRIVSDQIAQMPLFNNLTINRSLSSAALAAVFQDLESKGRLEWESKPTVARILWKTSSEWGLLVYKWATEQFMLDDICTLYELTQGERTKDQPFHSLDTAVMLAALQTLQQSGKCQIFQSETFDETGVKFFSV
eukprot:gnl/Spiro4/2016_TR969_c0_g1_i1.p1 gnl/Spiro4/2016_TR969_c0_g1~~gnl/Spiro4/2016_TR969_c0_g1_i1.p1  ORF type:complete len:183 (+),score=44.10 gnl/Spiro4/2016_TR969_c0_g1_i1:66-614(+)